MPESETPNILITGATGNIGRELTKRLSAEEVPFRAMVRSKTAATAVRAMAGAEAVIGDFNDSESIANALRDVDRVFLLTNSSEQAELQQSKFVDTARHMGISHIVKLSQWAADLDSPVRFLRYHAAVEQKIRKAGMNYTFLRPNLFMQGLIGFRETIMTQGRFFAAAGDAKISAVDVRDIAAAAAAALTGAGHEGKTYDLTGPEALSHDEIAAKLSRVLNRQIQYVDVSPAAMLEVLLQIGMPKWQADGLIEDYAHYRRGEASVIATGVQDATGTPPR
ncbi:MAG TPA: SDR family oxidoreductase, partial [Pyrinomonadaceae bacterium]|nr:SDR family oxidoreductase [Pyrinomonadaceae bacterium]